MRKKLLTVALAATMVVSSVFSAFADSVTVTNAAWWDAWTPAYELADGTTLEFDADFTAGGSAVYASLNAIFSSVYTDGTAAPADTDGYAEYVVLRSDNYGWGDDYANTTYTGTDYLYVDENTDYEALITGSHYDITISRSGNTIQYDYVITTGEGTELNCGYTVAATDLSAGCYVFFTGDVGTSFTLTLVSSTTSSSSSSSDSSSSDDSSSDSSSSDSSSSDDSSSDSSSSDDSSSTSSTTSPETADTAAVAVIAVVALGAAVAVVASKKKVTE